MSYQPGRMGVAEGIGLVFMVVFPRIFLSTPAASVGGVKTIAWVTPILSAVGGISMLWLLMRVQEKTPGDLYAVSRRLLGPAGGWVFALGYAALFVADAALLLRQFAENTLLTALPYAEFQVVIGWYAACVAILLYFGIEAVARVCYLLMPFVVGAILAVIFLLAPFYDIYNLFPWQGAGVGEALKRGLLLGGLNLGALLLPIFRPQFQDLHTQKTALLYGVGLSTLARSLLLLFFILAFGVAGGSESTLPFFEMSRLVYLGRFLQRIESLFIVVWVFVGLLSMAVNLYLALYLLSRPLGLPAVRPLIPTLVLIVVGLAVLPPDINSVIAIDSRILTTAFAAGMYGGPAVLFAAGLWRERRRQRWAAG